MGLDEVLAARRRLWLGGMLLGLMTFAAYSCALRGGFIWDDDRIVSENPLMTAPDGLRRIWTVNETDQYYPLVFSSFRIERKLWGLNPLGYHAVNVLLHFLNAVLAWLLLKRLGLKNAWFAAAVFALHPVHVESVAWISERKNVLSGFFYLLSLWCYLCFEENEVWGWYLGSLGLFVLALLSKTVACSLPVILLLLRWMRGRELRAAHVARLAPFLILGAAAGLLTSWIEIHHAGARGAGWDLSLAQKLLLSGRALCFYAGKLAWPSGLCFNYPRWELDPRDWAQWGWDILVLGWAAAAWRFRERLGREAIAGGLFFALTLSPALGFFKIFPQRYSYVADHFQYLASLGLIAVFAGVAARAIPAAAFAALLPLLGLLTWRQARSYDSPEVLWRETIRKNPRSFMAQANLGQVLLQRGKADEAIAHYQAALAIEPTIETRTGLGSALATQGRLEEAASQFRAALNAAPDYVEGHNLLGLVLAAQKRWPEAMGQYQEALKYNPRYVNAYLNIADGFFNRRQYKDAADYYHRVLWVNADIPAQTYDNAGYALAALGNYAEAARHFVAALQINPRFTGARIHLADALAAQGKRDEALAQYGEVLRIDPGNREAKSHAAVIVARPGSRARRVP